MSLIPRKMELRLGTRASLLALSQANWVKRRVEEMNPGVGVALVHIKTTHVGSSDTGLLLQEMREC